MTEVPLPYAIKLNFRNTEGLSVDWLDSNLAGRWSIGKEYEFYELFFEHEEDAIITWWKWG